MYLAKNQGIRYIGGITYDSGYPGVCIINDNIYVTFYSGNGQRSDIYFCEIITK